ncbi:DNA glycosylase AlkZ-like family protein [Nocardia sp. NPDC006044]|uniref:DNA glycosylase AlkZ-like family protein n=1 Tax=Nocardia sp. NPDC006044 TaxID=3364306 RepID=UPI0036818D16
MTTRKHKKGVLEVGIRDVIEFRLHAHHLTSRDPAESLHEAVGACGIQNSPPGSALLALNARVDNVTRDGIDELLGEKKTLLQTWSMRGSPFYLPTDDAPIFTTGVLPTSETARIHLIAGVGEALDKLGIGLDETVDRIAMHAEKVLSGRQFGDHRIGGRARRPRGRHTIAYSTQDVGSAWPLWCEDSIGRSGRPFLRSNTDVAGHSLLRLA